MKYVFYPDVFWVTNFAMDTLVLTLVRSIKKSRSRFWRILLSAALGASGSVLLFFGLGAARAILLFHGLHLFSLYQLITHLLLNPLMILAAFPQKSLKGFCKDLCTAYLAMMVLGGILSYGMTTLGQWRQFWIWALGGFGICMLILSWLESRKTRQLAYELLLLTKEQRISLTGFLDTGNLLEDPILKQPVHIIREQVLHEALTKEQLPVHYIPYHSLGQEHGLLPVVTLQAMYVRCADGKEEQRPLYIEKPIFGLAKENLFQKGEYQVILNARGICF